MHFQFELQYKQFGYRVLCKKNNFLSRQKNSKFARVLKGRFLKCLIKYLTNIKLDFGQFLG